MRAVKYVSTILLVSLVCGSTLAAEPNFPPIGELMSPEEYAAAGMHKLSGDERAALEAWLVRYTAVDAVEISKTSKDVQAVADARLQGHLLGEFTGWKGKTIFSLDSGERWQQIGNDEYYPRKKLMKPAVAIHRGIVGGYSLELLETGKRVKVRRIK